MPMEPHVFRARGKSCFTNGDFHFFELHGLPEIAVARIRKDARSTRFVTSGVV
ncbi:MAG: hypothetical protein CM1200mP9_01110 [Gammaproteobacteria bacterium]|nr:MAG: hypothetical protein CM1200mP9_01110 [Gammaproteobacteria bacterium]